MAREITVEEYAAMLARGEAPALVDVREDWEREVASIAGSVHLPMNDLPERWQELDPAKPVVLFCHGGVRSLRCAAFLERVGFADPISLAGGIDAWSVSVDPAVPRY